MWWVGKEPGCSWELRPPWWLSCDFLKSSAWNAAREHKVLVFPGVWSSGIRDSSLLVLWMRAAGNGLGLDPLRNKQVERSAKNVEKETR